MIDSMEGPNDSEVAALIREEPHRSAFGPPPGRRWSHKNRFLVGDGIGGVADGGLDIRAYQAGVCIEQVLLCRAFAELAQDQLNRNTSPTDDGFPHHDLGINLDPIRDGHDLISWRNSRPA